MELILVISLFACLGTLCYYQPMVGLAIVMAPGLAWIGLVVYETALK